MYSPCPLVCASLFGLVVFDLKVCWKCINNKTSTGTLNTCAWPYELTVYVYFSIFMVKGCNGGKKVHLLAKNVENVLCLGFVNKLKQVKTLLLHLHR